MSTYEASHNAWTLSSTSVTTAAWHILISFIIISCSTRYLSGRKHEANLAQKSPSKSATIPYWIPYIAHLFPFLLNPERFLQKSSQQSSGGVFSLNVWGTRHTLLSNRTLIQKVFTENAGALSLDQVRWYILVKVFGANGRQKEASLRARTEAEACVIEGLSNDGPGVSKFSRKILSRLQENVPELVSFNESIVDQNVWERTANPRVLPQQGGLGAPSSVADVNLFELIRNFVGHIMIPSLVGTDLMAIYPSILDDLWDLEGGSKYLALGLPRWFPIPVLSKANIARWRLLNQIDSFHRVLDGASIGEEPEQPWTDLGDVSEIMKFRNAVWQAHKISPNVKASADLHLLWAMNVKAASLAFWMLLHIFATPNIMQKIREEIQPHVTVTQPPQKFKIAEPPRLKIDLKALRESCHLLEACFYECILLHSTVAHTRVVENDFSVSEGTKNSLLGPIPRSFVMEAGTTVTALLGTPYQYPHSFESPTLFKLGVSLAQKDHPDRRQEFRESITTPWGRLKSDFSGGDFAQTEVMAFVAGILSLWEIEPEDRKEWVLPTHKVSLAVFQPSEDIRVRVWPREVQR